MHTVPRSIGVTTPFKALWRWLVANPVQSPRAHRAACKPAEPYARHPEVLRSQVVGIKPCAPSRASERRPLRMVRVLEAGQTSAQVGRMVISGRMADVCAELDRLAACEAPLH